MEPLDSRKYLNLATSAADCIRWRKTDTRTQAYSSPEKPSSSSWIQGKWLYYFCTFHPSTLFIAHLKDSQLPKQLQKPPPCPASAPFPRAVLLISGSEHLLYPTACSEAASPCSTLVAINLAAHSFSIDALLPKCEKSKRLGLWGWHSVCPHS